MPPAVLPAHAPLGGQAAENYLIIGGLRMKVADAEA